MYNNVGFGDPLINLNLSKCAQKTCPNLIMQMRVFLGAELRHAHLQKKLFDGSE